MDQFLIEKVGVSNPQLPSLLKLSVGLPNESKLQKVIASYSDSNQRLIGAFLHEKLIGVIGVRVEGQSATIRHLSISPTYRNCGLAKQLVFYVRHHFGVNKLTAETDDDAVGFYQALGFDCQAYQGEFGKRYRCHLEIAVEK